MFIDEVRLEAVAGFERFGAEETVVSGLIFAEVLMVVGPARFGGDK
jgi:hypothetical protein